jgi:tetratricopeptide (TPR) repeat protein
MALGDAYLVGKRYAEAAQGYQQLLETAPAIESARLQLAKALRGMGREAEAEALFTEPGLEAPGGREH